MWITLVFFIYFHGIIYSMKKKLTQYSSIFVILVATLVGTYSANIQNASADIITAGGPAILPPSIVVQLATPTDSYEFLSDLTGALGLNTKFRVNGNAILKDTTVFEDLNVQTGGTTDTPTANLNVGYANMASTPTLARMQVNGPMKVTSLNETDGLVYCVCADLTGTMRTCGLYNPTAGQTCLPSGGTSTGSAEVTYTWQVGPWSAACTTVTQNGWSSNVKTRSFTCINSDYQTVADSFCNADDKYLLGETTTEGCTQPTTGGKIICGELYRQGYLSEELWRADNKYATEYVSEKTIGLYHLWAQPIVNLMKVSPVATEIVKPFGLAWAEHMAYLEGTSQTDSFLGAALHNIFLPLHDAISGGDSSASPDKAMPEVELSGVVLLVLLIINVLSIITILISPVVFLLAYLSKKQLGLTKTLRFYRCPVVLFILTLVLAYFL